MKLFNYSRRYRTDVYLGMLYSVLNKLFDIMPEVLIGVAVDIIVKQHDSLLAYIGIKNVISQIIVLGVITAIIWILESTFQYLYSLKWCFLAQNIQHDMRLDTYSHVQRLQMEYFENKQTGNIMSTLNDDINQLERFLNDGINQILQIAASTILIAIFFFCISVKIALLSFIPAPLILIGTFYFRKKLAPRYLSVRNQAGTVNNYLKNNLASISTIKSFSTEDYELKKLSSISNDYRIANKNAIILSAAITPVIRMAVMSGFLVSLIYGGILTIHGQISIASYSILIFLSQRLLWPLTYLATVIDNYQRSMASVNRVISLLDTAITITDGDIYLPNKISGSIYFDKICFAYPNRSSIFSNFSLKIDPGQTVAFVGNTGSGKSTIVKLILRFYDVLSGKILVDGHKIRKIKLQSLRSRIGLVSQEILLINGTIGENIAYGTFDATNEQIVEAAKLVGMDTFIQQLPEGYNTHIGELGQKISGGQRQRIALARAIIKNPDILILDEATSALDSYTESQIQQSLEPVFSNRTTIIIAHRLSTVVNADVIYVLKQGKIVESGTHQKLLDYHGYYAELWSLQLRHSGIEES